MALRVLDGNQSATTLSSVVTGGEHIVAHSVVSLGANAIANITSAVSGSVVSVSNFPASQATTFGAITGSVSVLNFPSSQAVTFTQAPVTFGAVTGSVSILNFPATQSVTFGQTTVTGQVELGPTSLNALESITVTMGQVTVTGGLTNTELRASAVTIGGTVTVGAINLGAQAGFIGDGNGSLYDLFQASKLAVDSLPPISGTVTIGNSVTIGSLPAISGTVTANLDSENFNVALSYFCANTPEVLPTSIQSVAGTLPISGTVTANIGNLGAYGLVDEAIAQGIRNYAESPGGFDIPVINGSGQSLAISGTVTIGAPLNAGSTAVAVALNATDISGNVIFSDAGGANPVLGIKPVYHADITDNGIAAEVKESAGLPIMGSKGALTTRFGTPTTANTAFATSAVTNGERKYLLIQNVTTQSNVITVGIGFTPTTTQGIQLTAGAGITFESSYIPTGAVYVLSSVTASNFTILEA